MNDLEITQSKIVETDYYRFVRIQIQDYLTITVRQDANITRTGKIWLRPAVDFHAVSGADANLARAISKALQKAANLVDKWTEEKCHE